MLKTKKALATLSAGEVLQITATDPGSVKDLSSFCEQTGHEMLSSQQQSGEFHFKIRKS
ncbi:MAG: sulfurtransferase TusA family protein [Candidatus Thiodiazotropha sp.]